MRPLIHRLMLMLVVAVVLGLALQGCNKDEEKSKEKSEEKGEDKDDKNASSNKADEPPPEPRPQAAMATRKGRPFEIQGAVAYVEGASIKLLLSSEPMHCPKPDSGGMRRLAKGEVYFDLEFSNLLHPDGTETWAPYRTGFSGMSVQGKNTGLVLESAEVGAESVKVQLGGSTIKSMDEGDTIEIEGPIDALLCPGEQPVGGSSPDEFMTSESTLNLTIAGVSWPVAAATIKANDGKWRLKLSPVALSCSGWSKTSDVEIGFRLGSDRTSIEHMLLSGRRMSTQLNASNPAFELEKLGTEEAPEFKISGEIEVFDYKVGFDGGTIKAIVCKDD